MKFSTIPRLFVLFIVLLAGGCVHALNPFYRAQDLVFDPALVGQWCEEKEAKESLTNRVTWTFAAAEGKAYELTVAGVENEKPLALEFNVRLFRVEGQRFLDIFPTQSETKKPSEPYGWLAFFRPTHTVVYLPKSEESLVLQILDPKELEAYAEKHSRVGPFEKYEDRLLFTGSTRQLQQLLRESLRRTNWWGDSMKLSRCPP